MAIDAIATGGARGADSAPRLRASALAALAVAVLSAALLSPSDAGAADCPNESRRAEQGVGALPDCRAYELVTPAARDSAEPLGAITSNRREREPQGVPGARVALDGERMTWISEHALSDRSLARPYEPGTPGLQYLSRRSDAGWSTESTVPPQSVAYGLACQSYVGVVGWSAQLDLGVLADGIAQESSLSPGGSFAGESLECMQDEPRLATGLPPGLEQREGFQNLFLRDNKELSYRLLNPTPTGAPHPRPARANQEYFPASFLAGSSDLSHVVFEEELPLTEEAERIGAEVEEACERGERGCWEGHDNLYQWTEGAGGAGSVSLVTVLPDGRPVEGSLAGATRNNGGTERSPLLFTPNVANFRHAVSADGSHVFFEAGDALYVRQDGSSTVQIDSPRSGLPGATAGGGEFMAASADGSKVIFTDDASHLLTEDTVPGSGKNLYLCELPAEDGRPCELSNLTPAAQAGVLGVSGMGEAAQGGAAEPYLYFVATGLLDAGPNSSGATPLPGEPNLYVHHDGATAFIATLAGGEEGRGEGGAPCTRTVSSGSCFVTFGDSCNWTSRGGCRFIYENGTLVAAGGGLTSRVSEDGRFIAFNSIRPLTGYDNEDPSSEAPGEKLHPQIFVHDAVEGRLSCASCNPDASVRPTMPTTIRQPAFPTGATYQHAVYPQRNLSNDGQLFFESHEALLPQDTGDALSVYAWRAGELSLISRGESEVESIFLDATPDGSDVLFMTADRLAVADRDTAFDIYDARVGGGFPEASASAPACDGEAQCRRPASPAPAFPTPATSLFHGAGNQQQTRVNRRKRKLRKRRRGNSRRRGTARGKGRRARRAGAGARASALQPGGEGAAPVSTAASEEAVEANTAPQPVTEEARNLGTTSAELHGKIYHEVLFNSPQCLVLGLICHNSVGTKITACSFEYATLEHYESQGQTYDRQAPCEPPPPYSETEQLAIVKAAVTGLEPHTEYAYRLVAENEPGEVGTGENRTFMTVGSSGPPTIDDELYRIERSADGAFTVSLSADLNPHGHATTCTAQLVEDARFQESGFAAATELPCTPEDLPAGFADERVSAAVSGLPPATRYRFRFLARNAVGETSGADRTFMTFAVESLFAAQSRLQESGEMEQPYELLEPESQDLRAGGHPYELNIHFRLSTTRENRWGDAYPSFAIVNPKDIVTKLPPGLIGNPLATPRCAAHEVVQATCTGAAQVGVLRVEANRQQSPIAFPHKLPLYNLVPPEGVAAQFGAPLPRPVKAAAHIDAGLDAGSGYGVDASALDTTAAEGLIAVTATIWGVPHDTRHNSERFCPRPNETATVASLGGQCPSDEELESDPRPFLRNPTSCAASQQATVAVDAWQGPGDFVRASAPLPQIDRCAEVPFAPEIALSPTTAHADSPTGLRVDLRLPQPESPDSLGSADLRKAVVTLPEGLDVNPSSADGLAGCSPAQVDLGGEEPAQCPDASKIGAAEVESPLLDHPLRGAVYLATPHRNPFGSLLAIYIALADPRTGIVVKLAGQVEVDRDTGRLTASFDENPQLPFERFRLDFFEGARAALKTPAVCGSFATSTELTPWSWPEGAPVRPSSSFEIRSGPGGAACPDGHPDNPALSAGTMTPQAGAHSPFVLRVARVGDSGEIAGLTTILPPGLTGRLAGVARCSEGAIRAAASRPGRHEAAHPSCPAASHVGTVTVAAGAGPTPLQVRGDAYLAGPHAGAPLSLAIVTPAVAGPFDLGAVVVRAALHVDPQTARIRAVAGPIPGSLQGIPLDLRAIAVRVDRPRFILNPTSCEPMAIAGAALSPDNRVAPLGDRFQVGGCDALPFAPRLALRLKGRTRRAAHPALRAVLTARPGEANIAAAAVTLPRSQFLDQGNLREICTNVEFNAGRGHGEGCPASSIYGFARAQTPLLDRPLEGPVFLRASTNELPDLVAALRGEIDIALVGRVSSIRGAIRTSFDVVPDAPVTKFVLTMRGGKKGLIVNSRNLCAGRKRANVRFEGQNGKRRALRPVLRAVGCKGRKRKARRR